MKPKQDQRIPIGESFVIYPRGKKRIWTADFYSNGKHQRQSLKTTRKDIALQRVSRLIDKIETGEYQSIKKNTTIQGAAQKYLEYLKNQGRARRTLTRYSGELRTFEQFSTDQGIRRMAQVDMSLLDNYRAHRMKDHDLKTVYHESVVIKQLFNWSKKRKLIGSNPIDDYDLPKPRPKEKRTPTLEQVHRILKECTTRRKAEFLTLALTGMRSGELQGLKQGLVDLRGGWIDIEGQIDGETKTEGSVRSVPIHPNLLELLRSLPQHSHDLFFTSEPSSRYPQGGRPINTKRLNDYFKAAADRAGVESGFTVHTLRHFFKTHAINSGVPREMVDRWMGHVDSSVSARYYHVHDDASKACMAGIHFGNRVQ